jgi:hypothetical protein
MRTLRSGHALPCGRHEIVMRIARIVMRLSHIARNSVRMDLLAIILGIGIFALLLLLVEGIDRV